MSSHTGLLVNEAHSQRRRNSLTAALHYLRRRSTPTVCLNGRQNGDVQVTYADAVSADGVDEAYPG